MNHYNCLIIDDEPIARDIIQAYCKHLPILHVVASCSNALEARQTMLHQHIDLIFLDINMPVLDGIAFLKTLKYQPQIIFTTAYKEFAADAFDLSACDYLVKPFSLDRFIVAADRAIEKLSSGEAIRSTGQPAATPDYFFVRAEGKIYKIHFIDFLFAEAQGNHTRIVTTQSIIMPTMAISGLEEMLPQFLFPRIHRSFIIAKSRITHIEGNRVFIGKNEIPIGSNYKEGFMSLLGL